MTQALATLPFLAAIWLAAVIMLKTIAPRADRIVDAIHGRPCPQAYAGGALNPCSQRLQPAPMLWRAAA